MVGRGQLRDREDCRQGTLASGAHDAVGVRGPTRWRGTPYYERHRRWSADGTWDKIFAAVLGGADADGHVDWSMVSVDSTSCRAHQHAVGARTGPPRVPGKGARPGGIAPTRGSDALGAG